MADFPHPARFHLPTITSYSRESGLNVASGRPYTLPATAGTAHVMPTANLAFLVPFVIWTPYLVRAVFWPNGATTSGNVDLGVYGEDVTELLFNAGTTAQSGASAPQTVAVGPYLLVPGTYYMALVSSGTTGTFLGCGTNITMQALEAGGCAQAANGSLPLAASQTLAAPSSFGGVVAPLFGISSRVSTLI